jgi:hypothetical protein
MRRLKFVLLEKFFSKKNLLTKKRTDIKKERPNRQLTFLIRNSGGSDAAIF